MYLGISLSLLETLLYSGAHVGTCWTDNIIPTNAKKAAGC